uniref:Reverse transcriptase domain-containing protein n=1 Tax=Latimeria chalumnae TaxID=7897 RepID=H3B9H4_LATCH
KQPKILIRRQTDLEENHFSAPYTIDELNAGISHLKKSKAAGLDDICTEQIKHFGPVTKSWVLCLFNNCSSTLRIPKLWQQAHVIALLKPGKDTSDPKNFRPISLLCHLYKLYERLILNCLSPHIEQHLIPEQARFRPGKSCTGQILNITQHIEDGFERGMITGGVFVDLSAAYDTV